MDALVRIGLQLGVFGLLIALGHLLQAWGLL